MISAMICVLFENICYNKLWYVFRYRMSDINHDMCSVGEYHILTIYFFREYLISTMIHILKRKSDIMCRVRKHLLSAMVSVLWENISDMIRVDMCMFCSATHVSHSTFSEDSINKCSIIIPNVSLNDWYRVMHRLFETLTFCNFLTCAIGAYVSLFQF